MLEYEQLGQGPVVVLLHGAGGHPRDNFPFLDELAASYTVVAPSLPGVGGSSLGDVPLKLDDVVTRLVATLDDAGIGEFVVAGYSLGAAIAVQLAGVVAERVTAIALSAGFTAPSPDLLALVDLWSDLLDGDPDLLGKFILSVVNREETLAARGPAWIEEASSAIAHGFSVGTRAHLELLRTIDVSESLAGTSQPLLVVVPTADRLVDPSHADRVVLARPDAVRRELPAGHALGDEVPAEWFALLDDFFRETALPLTSTRR